MTLSKEQYFEINNLINHRNSIFASICEIKKILQVHFPDEYEKAIQFYIPQISTALDEHEKWLSRGEYSLQNTIDNLLQRCIITDNKGLKKYI